MFTWLNGQPWFGGVANLIQYTTVFTWAVVLWTIWHHRCAEPFCVRPGQVPKAGTPHKLCKKHAIRGGHTH